MRLVVLARRWTAMLVVLFASCSGRASSAQTSPTEEPPADEAPAETTSSADAEIEALVGPSMDEQLVVTASRTEQSVLEAPVSITVIGEQQIATSAAENVGDLLRGVPGLNVVQTSARDINVSARAPGTTLSGSQLALVDGRSIYQDFFSLVLWEAVPVAFDELEQVEVVRGPGSVVWGANALNGVINLRTKSPRELQGFYAAVGAGEVGTRQGVLRWADAHERVSYKVSGSWSEQDPWERLNTFADGTPVPESNEFDNEGAELPKLDLRLDFEPRDSERRFSYKAGYGGSAGLLYTGIGPFSINRGSFNAYAEVDVELSSMNAKLYVNRLDGDADNLLNGIDFAFETDTWVADVKAERFVGEKHALVFGGTARFIQFDLSLAPGEDTRKEVGVFLEDSIFLTPKLQWNVGLRADHFDTVGTVVSPRTSLIYKPRSNQSVRFSYSRAYRTPSLVNNYLDTIVPNLIILDNGRPFAFASIARGNPDLEEETVDGLEVAYTLQTRKSLFTAALYTNLARNTIDFHAEEYWTEDNPPSGGLPDGIDDMTLVRVFNYRNTGRVRDQGLELSLQTAWAPGVMTTASYTYQDPSEIIEGEPAGTEALNVNRAAKHQLSLGVSVQRGRWSGSFSAGYTDDAFWTDVLDQRFYGTTDDYVLLDGALGVKLAGEHVELRISGTNLLDDEIKQHSFGDFIRRKMLAEVRIRF